MIGWIMKNRRNVRIKQAKDIEKYSEYAQAVNPATWAMRNVKYGQKFIEDVSIVVPELTGLRQVDQRLPSVDSYSNRSRWRPTGVRHWFRSSRKSIS